MDGGVNRAIPLTDEEEIYAESALHAAIPSAIFDLKELDVFYDDRTGALWTYMNPVGRPSFTPPMLRDFENWHDSKF